jgi:hypothetical protein
MTIAPTGISRKRQDRESTQAHYPEIRRHQNNPPERPVTGPVVQVGKGRAK